MKLRSWWDRNWIWVWLIAIWVFLGWNWWMDHQAHKRRYPPLHIEQPHESPCSQVL